MIAKGWGKLASLLVAALLFIAPATARAQDASDFGGDRDVILQGFWWDIGEDLWTELDKEAAEFGRRGFSHVWLPPVMKGASGRFSMGYDTYDHYDLGEFDQKGSVPTRFGTLNELVRLVDNLRKHKVSVVADVNVTHVTGGENETTPWGEKAWTKFKFAHDRVAWDHRDFDFTPRDWKFGEHFNYWAPNARHALKEWGSWLTDKLGLDGYRVDQAKGLDPKFLREWLGHGSMWGKWAVAEYWDTDLDKLDWYVKESGSKVFDFPLFYVLREMANDQTGGFDMRRLANAGYVSRNPFGAVTFVENHDTDRSQPVSFDKMMAYSYILTMEGVPTVFYKDYKEYGLKDRIDPLLAIRHRLAGGGTKVLHADGNTFIAMREGADKSPGLVLVMNNSPDSWKGSWVSVKPEWAGMELREYTGVAVPKRVSADGRVELWAPPRGYAIYSIDVPDFDPAKPVRRFEDDDKAKDHSKDKTKLADKPKPADGLPPPMPPGSSAAKDARLGALIDALEAKNGKPTTEAERLALEAKAKAILARSARVDANTPGMGSVLDKTVDDRLKDRIRDRVSPSRDKVR